MFKNFMRILSPKYFARLSRDIHASVANLSPGNFGEFTRCNFRDNCMNVVRVSHNGRATVSRKHAKTSQLSGEKIKLSDICTNVMRHSHECRTTVVRIKMKISYICKKVVRHSWMLRDYRATVARYIFKIRPKFANLSHECLFSETAT